MKERPIIMTTDSVRAILDGRKTQTRRVIKFKHPTDWIGSINPDNKDGWIAWGPKPVTDDYSRKMYPNGGGFKCPYGVPGDRLWVRETFKIELKDHTYKRQPSIFMPRWASRITLEITKIRIERLQEINDEDCCRETGAPLKWPGPGPEPYKRDMHAVFSHLWDTLNAKRGYPWSSNPWVWVIEFKKAVSDGK